MALKVFLAGKLVGEICGDIYITHRKTGIHYYRMGNGYPISSLLLDKLKAGGVHSIVIVEHAHDGIKSYSCNLASYLASPSIQWAGFDEQRCVPLKDMQML